MPVEQTVDEKWLRAKAEKRLKARSGLMWHVAVYVLVNIVMWGVWIATSVMMDNWYFVWPAWATAGWGIGLAFHAVSYFMGRTGVTTKEARIREEMDRLRA